MINALQIVSAIAAFAAAYCWFLSAIGPVKPPSAGFGGPVPADDPFMVAFNRSMRWNRWGAAFAATSALASGLSTTFK